MVKHIALLFLFTLFCFVHSDEQCRTFSHMYEDLGCIPKFPNNNPKENLCSEEYDCSHIYNRPANKCHIKGMFLVKGEKVDHEITAGRCDHANNCECAGKTFNCIVPSDSCAEFWVPEFIKPGCFLTYTQNRCCSNGQICPPFTDVAECKVNGVTYKEGSKFNHPHKKCTTCICSKDFDGNFSSPACQKQNCTSELLFSSEIDKYCAPLFRDLDSCCPISWVCSNENGQIISSAIDSELKCKFEDKLMNIGDKYEGLDRKRGKYSCECLIPPYLTCIRR